MINVGIVGTGNIASTHAESLLASSDQFRIHSALDLDSAKLRDFCDRFRVPNPHASLSELVHDSEIDLVVVTTPPNSHEEVSVAALQSGKHVLCEKPLAHTLASANRIHRVAEKSTGTLSVAYQFRFDEKIRNLQWLSASGLLGGIRSAKLARHSFIPKIGNSDHSWWGKWAVSGGGVLITQQIHELDLLLLVMGNVASVTGKMDTRFTGIESEDFFHGRISFSNGSEAEVFSSVESGYLGGGMEFEFDKGWYGWPGGISITDESLRKRVEAEFQGRFPGELLGGGRRSRPVFSRLSRNPTRQESLHTRLYGAIATRIAGDDSPVVDSAEALRSLELCSALYESALIGKSLTLPLSPDASVIAGITPTAYAARRGSVTVSVPMVFRGATAPVDHGIRRVLRSALRNLLECFHVRPEQIRSFIRSAPDVHGGPVTRRYPWPVRKNYDRRELRAASRVLRKEMRVGGAVAYAGPEEVAYCSEFISFLGGGYADAVNSGSNAIYVALRALELPPGCEVIVPPITDPGGMMPVPLNLCVPVPADSDAGSLLVSASQIERVLSERTAAIIVAHLGGHSVDLDPILELAAKRGIPVLEDCAQAQGSFYKGHPVGTLGTIAAFSTMFGKQSSTGGQGGVVFTRDPLLFARVRQYSDRGKCFDHQGHLTNRVCSLNFNQDEIASAIGRVQLSKLPGFLDGRRRFAGEVGARLANVAGVRLIEPLPESVSSYWYLMLYLDEGRIHCDSAAFAGGLSREGIGGVHAGYSVYPTDQSWYRETKVFPSSKLPWSLLGLQTAPRYELPNAHAANRRIVRIEVHESLQVREAIDLSNAVRKLAAYHAA